MRYKFSMSLQVSDCVCLRIFTFFSSVHPLVSSRTPSLSPHMEIFPQFYVCFLYHSLLHFAHAPSLSQHQHCPQWISAFLILTTFIKTGGIIHRFPREIPDDVPTPHPPTPLAAFLLTPSFPLLGSNISLDSAGAVSFT